MKIMNLFDTEGFVDRKAAFPKYRGRYKPIAETFGTKHLGFHLRILDPKSFAWPYHWHTNEEELMIVIEGKATVRCHDEFREVQPGDLVFYGTGPDDVHQLYNHTDQPFKCFLLSNSMAEETCYYPDSNKKSEPQSYSQNGVEVDYYKDEEDPSVYWPKERL